MAEIGVYYFTLVPDLADEYVREHATIWPDMRDALISSGILDHRLYRRGDLIIGTIQCRGTIADTMRALGHFEVTKRWADHFSRFIAVGSDEHGDLLWTNEIWALDVGRDDSATGKRDHVPGSESD